MHSHRAVDQPSAFKSQNPPCPWSSSTCIPKCVPCTVSVLPRLTSPASMTFITGAGLVAASPPRAHGALLALCAAPRDLSEPAMPVQSSHERGKRGTQIHDGSVAAPNGRGGRWHTRADFNACKYPSSSTLHCSGRPSTVTKRNSSERGRLSRLSDGACGWMEIGE